METGNVVNAQPELSGIIDGSKSYMYEQLWKLCAGPLCDIPKLGENVYYFPQGNIELVSSPSLLSLSLSPSLLSLFSFSLLSLFLFTLVFVSVSAVCVLGL
jgi:hypothetical protein